MSRSRKKPYVSTTCSGSKAGVQKGWKQAYNRKLRRLAVEEELPDGPRCRRMVSDVWSSPSDGRYLGDEPKDFRK